MARKSKLSTNWVIRFVPNDVSRFIFHIIASSSSSSIEGGGTLGILRISHVCSSWRSIADNAPELWTNVVLAYRNGVGAFQDVEFLSLVLTKSRNMPLTMEMTTKGRPIFKTSKDVKALELFLRTTHRAKILKLDIDILHALFCFFDLRRLDETHSSNKSRLQVEPGLLLEKLEIHAGYPVDGEIGRDYDFCKLFCPAPSIGTLALYGSGDDFVGLDHITWLEDERIPFEQITSLELTCPIGSEALYDLLSLTTSLQSVFLNYVIAVDDTVYGPVELEELHTISLGGPSYSVTNFEPLSMMMGLESISSPALTTLRLSFIGKWSSKSFQNFLSISPTQIKNLYFDIVGAGDKNRICCLAMLPSLRTLDLTSHAARTINCDFVKAYPLGGEFISAMREWNDTQGQFALCPLLEKLTIDYDTLADTTGNVFADMIEDRWRRSAAGEKGGFELVIKRAEHLGDDPQEMIRLLFLKKAGLNLTIEPVTWLEKLFRRGIPSS
ncbi:hypothetical protein CVT26_006565 [Gymnopilus dilepis]|uniref:Uncharacterized protein n=1 Tax=Gymnopilus dilepis TaxID=231916 RepID=A0A409Y2U9_9AGAR|nr:hypothetical protein CVT26_006565 [Gymnopilus dilepis]